MQTAPSEQRLTPASTAGRSIARRLLFWFLAIALLPCALLTLTSARIASSALERSVRERLSQVAASKADEIDRLVSERLGAIRVLAAAPGLARAVSDLAAAPAAEAAGGKAAASPPETARGYGEFLRQAADRFGLAQLLIIDSDGRIVFAADQATVPGSSVLPGFRGPASLTAGFDRARALEPPLFSRFEPVGPTNQPIAFACAPILNQGQFAGALVIGMTPARIWEALSDFRGLGSSGEIVTGELQGDSVLVTAPLRHEPDAPFRRRLPLGSTRGSGTQRAASGEQGDGPAVDYRGQNVLAAWRPLPSLGWGLCVKQDANEAYAPLRTQRDALLGLSLATILAVTLAALGLARTFSRPIRTAMEVARRVASGDLRAHGPEAAERAADDETGALLVAIRTMTDNLRSLIGRIQQSSVALISTATSIQATSNEQQQVIADYGASTSEAVAAVKEISVTSQELLRTMTEVNEMAAHTGLMATDGRSNLANMDATMRQLAESTSSFGSKLALISEHAATINLAVTTITKVADQTNLLSINAAIEAEKAGEYGAGFLVVAREIRRLADQTAVASLDIEQMVKEMQHSVASGVMEMDKFAGQVQSSVREIAGVSTKLGEIISAVHGINDRFGQVTEGMRAQSQGAAQIREAMIRLSEGATRTASSLDAFNTATNHLRAAVGDLKEEVSRFTI
jgi:methyl-accepting chemotaxis protein WspA